MLNPQSITINHDVLDTWMNLSSFDNYLMFNDKDKLDYEIRQKEISNELKISQIRCNWGKRSKREV